MQQLGEEICALLNEGAPPGVIGRVDSADGSSVSLSFGKFRAKVSIGAQEVESEYVIQDLWPAYQEESKTIGMSGVKKHYQKMKDQIQKIA